MPYYLVMISEQLTKNIESKGVLREGTFHTKAENEGVLYHILRSQLYSNPQMAVVREYACNAIDSNVMSGRPTLPIRVTLPTSMEPLYKTRDFGHGLTEDEILDVFISYGESSKRNTDDAIGMLGLGCKSAFATGIDSFIVNSYQNGSCHSWSLYIDESQRGKAAQLSRFETSEPDGLEVIVPVKVSDVYKFQECAGQFFPYSLVLPEFVNISSSTKKAIDDKRARIADFSGSNWKFFNIAGSSSYAIMGGIPYPIDRYSWNDTTLGESALLILGHGCELSFKIGELDFSASRESLKFTDKTKKALFGRLAEIEVAVTKEIQDKFSNCKTLWEAKGMYHDIFDFEGKFYKFCHMAAKCLTFNGKTVTDNHFTGPSNQTCVYRKVKGRRYGSAEKIKGVNNTHIEASSSNLVLENTSKTTYGVLSRIFPLIEDGKYKKVYIVSFNSPAEKAIWMDACNYDGPMELLSSYPKNDLSKLYPQSVRNYSSQFSYKRVFELNEKELPNYYHKHNKYWQESQIDVDQDSGVYVQISSYQMEDKNGNFCSPNEFSHQFNSLKSLGVKIPVIYGIKPSYMARAKANTNMVLLWDWIKIELEKAVKQDIQAIVDRKNFYDVFIGKHPYFLDKYGKIKNKLGSDHPIFVFFDKLISLSKPTSRLTTCLDLCRIYSIDITGKVTYDSWKDDWKDILDRYPLVFGIFNVSSHYDIDSKFAGQIVTYIKMVDNCV